MRYEKILVEDSEKYFDLFDPDLYNPREWAKMAKAAGMKYAVITTKHHEGFCLFKTDYTDYQALNPPEGLKVGFYYSLLDWHHPDFEIDRIHPQVPKDPIGIAVR